MSVKGWAEAHRHEGGIIKYLYDKVKALDTASGGDESDIASIKEAIGKASGQGAGGILKDVKDIQDAIGDEDTAASILGRIKALEDAIQQS